MRAAIVHLVAAAAITAGSLMPAPSLANDVVGIVLMHGKLGQPFGSPGKIVIGAQLIAALTRAGYLVETPEMCWSRQRSFDLPYADCLAEIDQSIDTLKSEGATRIVVGGLSLGGNAAIAYGTTHGDLAGVIALSPADDPGRKAQTSTGAASIAEAEALLAQGQGDTPQDFADMNTGPHGHYEMVDETTPRIFLSFYGPDSAASIPANCAHLKVPILWVAGSEDPTQTGPDFAFDKAPLNPLNRYVIVAASHTEVPDAGKDAVLAWLHDLGPSR